MARQKAQAALARTTLPSVTVPMLAEQFGLSVQALGEYIKTEQLTCQLLLYEQEAIPPSRDPYSSQPREPITLNGYYRLPTKWAVAALRGVAGYGVEVVLKEPDQRIGVSVCPGPADLRVMREEAERFEREVISVARQCEVAEPAIRQTTLHHQRCRAIAAYMWSKDPSATIVDVAASHPIKEFGCERKEYRAETIQGWINDLCPDRRPGTPSTSRVARCH